MVPLASADTADARHNHNPRKVVVMTDTPPRPGAKPVHQTTKFVVAFGVARTVLAVALRVLLEHFRWW